jgi:gamma-glutamyltranspeptidase
MGSTATATATQFKVEAVFPTNSPPFVQFASRRSVVHSTKGMVACTQPLAAEAGQRVLKMGGNAAVRLYHTHLHMRSVLDNKD